jgi:invasion protein IalB
MMNRMVSAACTAALVMAAGIAQAQESDNQVAVKTDWSVFAEDNPKECWAVSVPKESVNTKDGQPATVRRGDIQMFVTYRPGAAPELSFTGGYPFAKDSTVTVDVDGNKFEMFVDGEWAWPQADGAQNDTAILAAMQKGNSAVLSAHSAKGTQTKDTFSLRGFTAAMDEASKRCK